jgi:hypothetical protein
MNWRPLLCALCLVGVTVLVTHEVCSQEEKAPRESQADTESLVDTWVRHAMPGQEHKLLERMAGSWSLAVKYRMNADAPVVESEGTCQRKWILGNRFLLEEFDGGSLAVPFQGLAIYGYDAFEQKYTSAWVDTTNTAITTSLGTCRDSCETVAFTGRHGDPWTGVKRDSRGVTRFVDQARHVLELYETGSDGREFRILEITYTRK